MPTEKIEDLGDRIIALWEKDSKVDRYNISEEGANISSLHFKYLRMLKKCMSSLAIAKERQKKLFLDKKHYYSGKDNPEVYKRDNFHLKVLNGDLDTYIKADDEYSKLNLKIVELDNCIEIIKSILEQLKNRNYILKSIVDWERFQSGG